MHALLLPTAIDAREAASRLSDLPGLCWLDGDRAHPEGRYAFVAAAPSARVSASVGARDVYAAIAALESSMSAALDAPAELEGAPHPSLVPRFIGYLAYDACFAGALEGRQPVARHARPSERPVLELLRFDAVLAFDLVAGRGFVLGDDRVAVERLRARLERGVGQARACHVSELHEPAQAQHRAAIEAALEQIARGNVYQVNLARRFEARLEGDPLAFFVALRDASPVPRGFYCDSGKRIVAARSMECFLRWQRQEASLCSRPIKGTIARGGLHDHELSSQLAGSPKEHAEHAMIVDLMRNDLSRVAEPGSVRVLSPFTAEPYAKLLHLVSTVACRNRPETTLADVLRATFPPGSVTGTPKLAAIDLIERLEPVPRDIYTGALGFIDRHGGLSLAVAIRTAVIEQGRLTYCAGGGIVAESNPDAELAETELKTEVLRDALRSLALASS